MAHKVFGSMSLASRDEGEGARAGTVAPMLREELHADVEVIVGLLLLPHASATCAGGAGGTRANASLAAAPGLLLDVVVLKGDFVEVRTWGASVRAGVPLLLRDLHGRHASDALRLPPAVIVEAACRLSAANGHRSEATAGRPSSRSCPRSRRSCP